MLSRTVQRSKTMLAQTFNVRRERKAHAAGRGLPQAQIGFCFGVDGFTRTDSYHTPPTRNDSTTKQALGEAGGVRRDVTAQRLDKNFTLGQRVKLRLAEPINAALESRA